MTRITNLCKSNEMMSGTVIQSALVRKKKATDQESNTDRWLRLELEGLNAHTDQIGEVP